MRDSTARLETEAYYADKKDAAVISGHFPQRKISLRIGMVKKSAAKLSLSLTNNFNKVWYGTIRYG